MSLKIPMIEIRSPFNLDISVGWWFSVNTILKLLFVILLCYLNSMSITVSLNTLLNSYNLFYFSINYFVLKFKKLWIAFHWNCKDFKKKNWTGITHLCWS